MPKTRYQYAQNSGKNGSASGITRGKAGHTPSATIPIREEQIAHAFLQTTLDSIITINEHGVIQSANATTERMFGYHPSELAGQKINVLMPEPFHTEHDGYIRNYTRTRRAKIIGIGREVLGLRKDRSTFSMHLAVGEILLKKQRLFIGVIHDLSERRRLERRIIEAAASEQRRIGQDLHDGLCQDLIGIAFGIDSVARNSATQTERESMSKLAASVREAAGQARRLSHGLNPVDLNAGGLSAAFGDLTTKVTKSFGVRCTFHWDGAAQASEDATATHLYRISQEAVGNAIRHGKASKIQIRLNERGKSLILSISDNGKGIPQAIAASAKLGITSNGQNHLPSAGIGLQTMHYRARVMGGTFVITPRKGGGTKITCTISQAGPSKSDKDSGKHRQINNTRLAMNADNSPKENNGQNQRTPTRRSTGR
jgi:PAS domain S-box-containing protein